MVTIYAVTVADNFFVLIPIIGYALSPKQVHCTVL